MQPVFFDLRILPIELWLIIHKFREEAFAKRLRNGQFRKLKKKFKKTIAWQKDYGHGNARFLYVSDIELWPNKGNRNRIVKLALSIDHEKWNAHSILQAEREEERRASGRQNPMRWSTPNNLFLNTANTTINFNMFTTPVNNEIPFNSAHTFSS